MCTLGQNFFIKISIFFSKKVSVFLLIFFFCILHGQVFVIIAYFYLFRHQAKNCLIIEFKVYPITSYQN